MTAVGLSAFRAPLVAAGAAGISRSEPGGQVAAFCREPQPAKAIMAEPELKQRKTFQANHLAPLMAMGILETVPDKPRSRMQRYRTPEAGRAVTKDKPTDQGPRRGGDGHA